MCGHRSVLGGVEHPNFLLLPPQLVFSLLVQTGMFSFPLSFSDLSAARLALVGTSA